MQETPKRRGRPTGTPNPNGGRPPLGSNARSKHVHIRVTPTEKATLRALCEREGLTEREVLLRGIDAQMRSDFIKQIQALEVNDDADNQNNG